jgi:hypothetical protein
VDSEVVKAESIIKLLQTIEEDVCLYSCGKMCCGELDCMAIMSAMARMIYDRKNKIKT